MSKLRITPLNIVSALLLTWLLWWIWEDDYTIAAIGWILLLLLAVVLTDQFFRLMLRSLKRVWMVEGVFVVLVVVVIWVIRVW